MSIKIMVNSPQQIFQAGMSIIGKVICNLETSDWIDVKIKFVGGEYTFVNTSDRVGVIGHKRKFFDTDGTVLKSGRFDPGENEFYFNLVLPRNIPSTFQGKQGDVKYFLMARMDVRWQEVYGDDLELIVFSPILLNIAMLTDSETPKTHRDEITESEGLWCYPEVAMLEVTMYRKVFMLYEDIPVEVRIQSRSRTITTLKIEIFVAVQGKLSSRTGNQNMVTTTALVALKREDFNHPQKDVTLNYHLNIMPTAKLPNFEKCMLFKHRAFMKVTAFIQHSKMPQLTVEFGIILGHISVNNDRGNHTATVRQRSDDVPILRKISSQSAQNHVVNMPMPSASCISLRGDTTQLSPFSERFPGEASSQSTPGIGNPPPPSYSSIMVNYIGFRIPQSSLRRDLIGPSISSSEPNISPSVPYNIVPSAPPEEETDFPFRTRTPRVTLGGSPEEASGSQIPTLPTPPADEVDLPPPTYEESLLLNRKNATCEQRRRVFAS